MVKEAYYVDTEQIALVTKKGFIAIQTCDDGYDYSIYDTDYQLLDGGVYDNPDISIEDVLDDILEDVDLLRSECIPMDFCELEDAANAASSLI